MGEITAWVIRLIRLQTTKPFLPNNQSRRSIPDSLLINKKVFKDYYPIYSMDFTKTWKKYGEPITGISIILFVIFSWYMIIQDRQLKEEINENCGWGDDDYRCYCEKSEALAIKNKMDNDNNINDINWSLINDTVDG